MTVRQLDGFVEVDCNVAELIVHSNQVSVYSGATDISGEHGEPRAETKWCLKNNDDIIVLHNITYFDSDDHGIARCVHFVPSKVDRENNE